MIEINDKKMCCGCQGCFNICPEGAIEMFEDEIGFKYPRVDREKCIECGLCKEVCPMGKKDEITKESKGDDCYSKDEIMKMPKAYACYNKDEAVRMESSSGGVFSLLAEQVLKNNGVIYGAAFDENWLVEHIRVDNKEDLERLRTSKYLQSNINDSFRAAKEDLEEGRTVLFTGTPCQVNGFMSYLNGKKYDNLYTQDIICHGVPSSKVWKKYLEYRAGVDKKAPEKINFRCKDVGWNLYSIILKYREGFYREIHLKDLFMQAFLADVCLRESCYSCNFKEKYRKTDITLGDFWGIDRVLPGFDDDKGTSLVSVNTEKGGELFDKIEAELVFKEVDFEKSVAENPYMCKSAKKSRYREAFFEDIDRMEFDKLVRKYVLNKTIVKRGLKKLKRMIVKTVK